MAFYVKQKNRARFGLRTDKFCLLRAMNHNFGTVQPVSWPQREPNHTDHFPTTNLW
jgi:hypothetical protein